MQTNITVTVGAVTIKVTLYGPVDAERMRRERDSAKRRAHQLGPIAPKLEARYVEDNY